MVSRQVCWVRPFSDGHLSDDFQPVRSDVYDLPSRFADLLLACKILSAALIQVIPLVALKPS